MRNLWENQPPRPGRVGQSDSKTWQAGLVLCRFRMHGHGMVQVHGNSHESACESEPQSIGAMGKYAAKKMHCGSDLHG